MGDLMAGRLDVASTTMLAAMPLLKSGKVRALAVLNDKRSSLLPDIPTIAEQGIPEYNYASWFGIVAPGETPSAVVNRLNEGLVKVARMPGIITRFAQDSSTAWLDWQKS